MSKSAVKTEFWEKLSEAKKLEKEAFMLLIPEQMRGHLEVIGKEAGEMFFECMLDLFAGEKAGKQAAVKEKDEKKVKQVTID